MIGKVVVECVGHVSLLQGLEVGRNRRMMFVTRIIIRTLFGCAADASAAVPQCRTTTSSSHLKYTM
jgi:hypothetical protein